MPTAPPKARITLAQQQTAGGAGGLVTPRRGQAENGSTPEGGSRRRPEDRDA